MNENQIQQQTATTKFQVHDLGQAHINFGWLNVFTGAQPSS